MAERTIVAEGKFLRLVNEGRWEYAERTHPQMPVAIVAVTEEGKLLLIEQYRIPVHASVIEIPAGLVGDHGAEEAFEVAAKRELLEETGYSAEGIEWLATGPSTAGMCSEMSRIVRATGVKKVGAALGDGEENITVIEVPLGEVGAYLKKRNGEGTLVDWKVWVALWFLRQS